jgi:SAM-dependent methyltransferase
MHNGLVVDIGCGGGTLDATLINKGYRILGIDISPSMVRLARKRNPSAKYIVGSWADVPLPQAAAVLAIGECLSYHFDGRHSIRHLQQFFTRAASSLLPGGILLFDILTPLHAPERREVWREAPDGNWAVHVVVTENARTRTLTRRITSFRRTGNAYRRTDEVHTQGRLDPDTVERYLRGAGFQVKRLAGYGREMFRKGQIGFLARRRPWTNLQA